MLIQFLLIVTLAIAFIVTWKRVKEHVISAREGFAWSVLWVAAFSVILLPDITSIIARAVGIGRGVDLVIYAAITLLFVLVFKIFLTLDRLEQKLTELVRTDALRGLNKENE